MSDLAKRAVACEHWWWMQGMLAVTTVGQVERKRVLHVQGNLWQLPDNYADWVCDYPDSHEAIDPTMVPDLTDAATLGCLLALVREAWKDSTIHVAPAADGAKSGWACLGLRARETGWVKFVVGDDWFRATEAEALVAALEATRLPARGEAIMTKRRQIVDYDDWLTTDPDAEGDDSADDTDDWQEPDDTPELEPEYTYWRDVC